MDKDLHKFKHIKKTCCVLLFISFQMQLFAQTGSVKGTVLTSDLKPAQSVTISIKGIKESTANNKGEYILNNINPGNYTVTIKYLGLNPQSKSVEVFANQTSFLNFLLPESGLILSEVIVLDKKNKYKEDKISPSLRLETPILEIPQNIQIVTSAVLNDQQILSMSDGLIRNVSGITRLEHWGDLYTNLNMRGSQIQAFRNGVNAVASFWGPLTEDMSSVDHIEFVKGPAGFMLANGDPAGLYNVVTKKPTGTTKGEASFTFGSFDLIRSSVDLDGKLSKDGRLLYRLNVAGQKKNSFRAYEYNDRNSFAPVISYQINDKTKITAEYTLQNARMSDVGSFYVFSPEGYAVYPRNFTSSAPGIEPTKINDHSAFLNLQHQLNTNWKLTAQGAYFNYQHKGTSLWPNTVNTDGTMLRAVGIWDAKSEMTMGQVFLNGDVKTGNIRHRILTGLDLGSKNYMADWSQNHLLDTIGNEFEPKNPINTPSNGYPIFDRTLNLEARAANGGGILTQRYTGLYFQDELGFLENKIRLTLAGRYTYVSQSSWGGLPDEAKKFTPRIGLSISITPQTSIYTLYDQAFIPQSGNLFDGSKVKPITGDNTEFGIKKDWFDGKWNSTLSFYRIIKKNELTSYGPIPGMQVEIGKKRSQGIELDIRGEIIKGLNLTANYAYTDAKVTEVNNGVDPLIAEVGQRLPGADKHILNSWLGYKIQEGKLKRIGISSGLTYLIDRATSGFSSSNVTYNLPNYFKLDGGIFYEKDQIRLTANAYNVLDTYLYSGSYYTWLNSYYWQAEAPRNYRLSVTYKF